LSDYQFLTQRINWLNENRRRAAAAATPIESRVRSLDAIKVELIAVCVPLEALPAPTLPLAS
jgi:hypothetical protein